MARASSTRMTPSRSGVIVPGFRRALGAKFYCVALNEVPAAGLTWRRGGVASAARRRGPTCGACIRRARGERPPRSERVIGAGTFTPPFPRSSGKELIGLRHRVGAVRDSQHACVPPFATACGTEEIWHREERGHRYAGFGPRVDPRPRIASRNSGRCDDASAGTGALRGRGWTGYDGTRRPQSGGAFRWARSSR